MVFRQQSAPSLNALALNRENKLTGRPKGSKTSFSKPGRLLAQKLLGSDTYREKLKKRLETGELPANLEAMLWAYAYGRPPDTDAHERKTQGAVINVITASPEHSTEKQIGRSSSPTHPGDADNSRSSNSPDQLASTDTKYPDTITIDLSDPGFIGQTKPKAAQKPRRKSTKKTPARRKRAASASKQST